MNDNYKLFRKSSLSQKNDGQSDDSKIKEENTVAIPVLLADRRERVMKNEKISSLNGENRKPKSVGINGKLWEAE